MHKSYGYNHVYCIGSHQTKMYVTYLQIRHVYIYIYKHHIYSYLHIFACHTVMIILSFLPCSSIQLVNLGSCDSPLTPPKASGASASRRSWNLRPAHRVARNLQNDPKWLFGKENGDRSCEAWKCWVFMWTSGCPVAYGFDMGTWVIDV